MNGGLRFRGRRENVLESLSDLGGDVASLVELQAKLTAIDLKETIDKATYPTVTLAVAAVVLIGAIPVMFIGLAFVLAIALSISQGASLLIVGVTFALIGGVIGWIAMMKVLQSLQSFRRSREELIRNIAWVRTVIAQSGRETHRS